MWFTYPLGLYVYPAYEDTGEAFMGWGFEGHPSDLLTWVPSVSEEQQNTTLRLSDQDYGLALEALTTRPGPLDVLLDTGTGQVTVIRFDIGTRTGKVVEALGNRCAEFD